MSYAPYPAYKDSGVTWLGQVPESWDVWKVSHGFRIVGSGTTPRSDNPNYYDGDVPWVTTSELREKDIFDTRKKLTDAAIKDHSALKLFSENALIIAMYGATIGRLGRLKTKATVNQACCVFDNPKAFDSRFVYWWFQMAKPVLISEASGGGQPNLSQEFLKQVRIPVPEVEEQTAIADFLDKKTAEIDDLIAKQEELLRLLAEQRTALITHAVTKGLNPNTPMKPSGIDWLGDVPEGWEVKKIKYLVNYIGSGKTPRGGAEIYTDEGVMILRSQNIYDDGLRLKDVAYVPEEVEALQRNTRVRPGDVLLNITGASIGRSSIVPDDLPEANVNQHVCIFRSLPQKLDSRFLHAFFCSRAGKEQVSSNENGTSREGLNFQQAGNLTLAIPPRELQTETVQHLDIEIGELDKVVSKTTHAVERLKEYRTALITNAVTGKIKVG